MRAGTAARCAALFAREPSASAPRDPTRAARDLIERHVRRYGPPPDPARTVLASDGCTVYVHRYEAFLAKLRATRDRDACRCADILEAFSLPVGAFRCLLGTGAIGTGARWSAVRMMVSTAMAPGGEA